MLINLFEGDIKMTIQAGINDIRETLRINTLQEGEPIKPKEPGYGVLTIFKVDKPYLENMTLPQRAILGLGMRLKPEIEEPMLQKTRSIARGLTEKHVITDKDLESLNTHMINPRAAVVLISTMAENSNNQNAENRKPVNVIISDLLANMDPKACAQLVRYGFDSNINQGIKTDTTELNVATISIKPHIIGGLLLMGKQPRENILTELKKLNHETATELINDIIRNWGHPNGVTAGAKLINISLEKLGIKQEDINDKIQDTVGHILDMKKKIS